MSTAGPPPERLGARSLDPHLHRYAARAAGMTASEVRALFAVASRPEVVSLAGGMPNLTALPLDSIATEMAGVVSRDGLVALQYGSAHGLPELRAQICEVMSLEGVSGHPDDLVVTVGSQMALDMVTRIFCDPGDVVLAEGPSYVGRSAPSPRTRPTWCMWAWTVTVSPRRRCGRRWRRRSPAAGG